MREHEIKDDPVWKVKAMSSMQSVHVKGIMGKSSLARIISAHGKVEGGPDR